MRIKRQSPADNDAVTVFQRLEGPRARLAAQDETLLATQMALSAIPAPTGSESARAAAVAERFSTLGLLSIHVDAVGNVLATRHGETNDAPVVVCAHLDTIFPDGTSVAVTRDGSQLAGPGIVDNSRGLAAMLALAGAIDGRSVRTRRPIVFVATVGEEGAGDLRGAKHLFTQFKQPPSCCIALDGAGDDRIVTQALGARRYRVVFSGTGGHSWSSFGEANPVHAAGGAAAKLAALTLPRSPRTTLSVCRIGGGISVNAIPDDAWLELDLRSSSTAVLADCARAIHQAIHAAVREENSRRAEGARELTWTIETIGDRPCGETDPEHPLVRAAIGATRAIGKTPELSLASTDANVPISLGVPAIAIGAGGRAGGVHTTAEWYDNVDGQLGVARALTVLASAAELVAAD